MALFRETSDVSVRPAVPDDAAVIAGLQLRAWRSDHADVLGPDVLELIDAGAVRARWAEAIGQPPSAAHRVLVALDGARVVGVATTVPVADDAVGVEITTLEVDPDHQRTGHGSRLLTACVDLGRTDGATEVRTWVLDGDPAREQFLAGAGLGPDGTARRLGVPGDDREVAERRWVAEI